METIDISKLDKAEVLAALYNASKQQGMGFLNPRGREPLSKAEASELLKERTYFEYLAGRVMKVRIERRHTRPVGIRPGQWQPEPPPAALDGLASAFSMLTISSPMAAPRWPLNRQQASRGRHSVKRVVRLPHHGLSWATPGKRRRTK